MTTLEQIYNLTDQTLHDKLMQKGALLPHISSDPIKHQYLPHLASGKIKSFKIS